MEANHEYCRAQVLAMLAERPAGAPPARVLDYGCGAAHVVRALRADGVEAYGADVFYEGGSHFADVDRDPLFASGAIRQMTSDITDFPDGHFDIVFSNMVLEHVVALETVVAEQHRLLKPGGRVLNLFPDRGVWREGHIGVPFSHWFGRDSALRLPYVTAARALGLGYHKKPGQTPRQWAEQWLDWIDRWTHYRPLATVIQGFRERFVDIRRIEDQYLAYRLSRTSLAPLSPLVGAAPLRPMVRGFVRRASSLVLTARRAAG